MPCQNQRSCSAVPPCAAIRSSAKKHPSFAHRLQGKNLIVQVKLRDNSQVGYLSFKDGGVTSTTGTHSKPDLESASKISRLQNGWSNGTRSPRVYQCGEAFPDPKQRICGGAEWFWAP